MPFVAAANSLAVLFMAVVRLAWAIQYSALDSVADSAESFADQMHAVGIQGENAYYEHVAPNLPQIFETLCNFALVKILDVVDTQAGFKVHGSSFADFARVTTLRFLTAVAIRLFLCDSLSLYETVLIFFHCVARFVMETLKKRAAPAGQRSKLRLIEYVL